MSSGISEERGKNFPPSDPKTLKEIFRELESPDDGDEMTPFLSSWLSP